MDKSAISSWVRQGRHRARKYGNHADVTILDIENKIQAEHNQCLYCRKEYETLDCIFPLKSQAPFVPSNISLICESCRVKKGNDDLSYMFNNGKISQEMYIDIIKKIIDSGDERMIDFVKLITGIVV